MAFKEAKKTGGGDYPGTWQKDTQKVIEGTVVDFKQDIMGKPGANVIVLETEDGPKTVWLDKVLSSYPDLVEIGTKVRITFLGKEKSKSGPNMFNNYKVEIDQ
jgi:uncharacterized OB-fold protein